MDANYGQAPVHTINRRLYKSSAFYVVLALLWLGCAIFVEKISHAEHTFTLFTLASSAIFSLIIFVLGVMVTYQLQSPFRYFFLLIAIEQAIRLVLAIHVFGHIISGTPILQYHAQSFDHWQATLYGWRPVTWLLFALLMMIQLKAKWRYIWTVLLVVITAVLVLSYLSYYYLAYHHHYAIPLLGIIAAIHDFAIFFILIICLPTAKRFAIVKLLVGFMLILIAYLFASRMQLSLPNFSNTKISPFFWVAGNGFVIDSLISLLRHNKDNTSKYWFYPINAARVQLGYWSASIASLMLIFIGIRNTFLFTGFAGRQFIYNMDVKVYMLYMIMLMFVEGLFVNLITRDTERMESIISSKKKNQCQHKLYFRELRQLARVTQEADLTVINRSKEENKLFDLASNISSGIKKPMTQLDELSEKLKSIMPADKHQIFQNALARISNIAADLSSFQQPTASRKTDSTKSKQRVIYVGLLLSELMVEKDLQYQNSKVNFHYLIDEPVLFSLAEIEPHHCQRVISNLINNAVEATENSPERDVRCELQLDKNKKLLEISITDNGEGMTKQQVRAILGKKSVTTKQKGFGIGLRYVMGKLKQWQAKCEIHSKKGKGTSFTILIPLISSPPCWYRKTLNLYQHLPVIFVKGNAADFPQWDDIETINVDSKQALIQTSNNHKAATVIIFAPSTHEAKSWVSMLSNINTQYRIVIVADQYKSLNTHSWAASQGIGLVPKPLFKLITITSKDEE